MAELDIEIKLKLIEIAESKANVTSNGMGFQSEEEELEFWINNFGNIYKKLINAIIE